MSTPANFLDNSNNSITQADKWVTLYGLQHLKKNHILCQMMKAAQRESV